ncbi:hypothetical protein FS749_000418 [Ceratobasidium sp. UAMH 11750]|nr:hypothetical protein FS749_000418 [Ceratobasidium sp. UAMH 11750]
MENPRRFIPTQSKTTAPSTPNAARRVLPTPPATETPAFRHAPAGNAVDSSLQRSNARPSTAQGKNQSDAAPKLNIARFKQNKAQKNGSHGDNRATHSPTRPSRSLPQAQVQSANCSEAQNTRASSIFGRQTGLLPPLTRQFSPMSPGPMPPPAQPSNSRFSSPVSSIAEDDTVDNGVEKSLDSRQADSNDSEAHTSAPNAFGPTRVAVDARASHQQRAFQRRTAALHDDTHILDAYINAHHGEWLAAQKRWENCTMEEWKNGPSELVAELNKVMDMVKDFMMQVPVPLFFHRLKLTVFRIGTHRKRMEVYAGINRDVDAHKLRLDARDAMLAKEKGRLVKQAGGLAGAFVVS